MPHRQAARISLSAKRRLRSTEQAKVGRSTFYDLYSSAEEIFARRALAPPFGVLADAAAG